MFCPKCGNADQLPETYCRQCGVFLPDLSKPLKRTGTPEEHVTANTVLSAMTIVTSFTLAILIWVMLAFKGNTHPLIYVTAGLLFAMGVWHVQTLWRTLLLRKYLKKNKRPADLEIDGHDALAGKRLESPDFEDMVPPSVTDRTTKHLSEKKSGSSQPEH